MSKMKSAILTLVVGACFCGAAMAAEFTPLNFEDTATTSVQPITIASSATSATSNSAAKSQGKQVVTDTTGNKKMQSAITDLDSAQVEVRNELLEYKNKYASIDAKYNTVKSERAEMAKKIRACEKKIKNLDKTKEKIKKSMI